MKFNYLLALLIVLFTQKTALSQEGRIDSLSTKTFEELKLIIFDKNTDSILKSLSIESFLIKAKNNSDEENILTGLYIKAVNTISHEERIKLYDSIIKLSITSKNKGFLTLAYYDKGVVYYKKRKFKEALDNYLLAIDYNNGSNKEYLEFLINRSIAALKNRIDYDHEALILYKRCLKYAEMESLQKFTPEQYFSLLASLANSFRENKDLDSAQYYNSKALALTSNSDYYQNYNHLLINDGLINYDKGNFNRSYDSIVKGLKFIKSINDKPNAAVGHYYLGKLHIQFNNVEKAIHNFKSVDTIFQSNRDILPETRESYKFLSNYYKEKKDLSNELLYIERLLEVDSVLADNYKFLSKEINQEYDRPQLLAEKEKIISKISSERTSYLVLSVVIFFALLVISGLYFYKQNLNKRKLEELLNKTDKKKVVKETIKKTAPKELSEYITKEIMKGLGDFESNKEYLNSNISIQNLAKSLNTNTSYLSKIINHYKAKNFIRYINDLRIDYLTEELKTNKNYRKYTIRALAREAGFNSTESFSTAFKKRTGIKPSYFLKNLNKSQ